MAAVIIAAFKARKRRQQADEELERAGTADLLDTNNDGRISAPELLEAFDHVGVRIDLMLQRLRLEQDLTNMMIKLPNFLVCLLCFVAALCEFSPPAAVHNVHQHIKNHFQIDDIKGIGELDDIYPYIEKFAHRNEEMQATSFKYWCEERYADHHWDDSIHAPVWSCPSPRLYSLGLSAVPSYSWTQQCTGAAAAENHCHGPYVSNAQHSADATTTPAPHHRRLSSKRRLSGGGSSNSHYVGTLPPCLDNDTLLQEEEGNSHATCAHDASQVCEIDLGILACPFTCGYCAPFTYQHYKHFQKPQVTMLPVVLYQTRFAAADCHGFAETYEAQPYNPHLMLLPAMDGYRSGRVLTCVDRTKHYEEPYRAHHSCPSGSPSVYCKDGIMHETPVHRFHGTPIYPKVLIEPARDIAQMKSLEWIDLLVEELTLSTMVYTEGSEIFTSVSVVFTMNEAGTVTARHKLISYRDLIKGSKTIFITCMIICSVGALVGAGLSVYTMMKHPENCRWGFELYELFSRVLLFAYPLVLLISWTQQTEMAEEYDHLLHTFLDIPGTGHEDLDNMITNYFDVKTHIYEETQWLLGHRCFAYILLYIQFLQLIFYFSAHPKMAVLTDTISKAMSNIVHFLMLFGILFFMLAFMAHWMLGEHITEFGSFGDTISAQGRMIYGEFIYASSADELNDMYVVMYWLYAFTFMMIIFFTLLNFFLAIIVDAFADVKSNNDGLLVVRGFLTDLGGMLWTLFVSCRYGWPSRKALIQFFTAFEGDEAPSRMEVLLQGRAGNNSKPMCFPEDMQKHFPEAFSKRKRVAIYLAHYALKCEEMICSRNDESVARLAAAAEPVDEGPSKPLQTPAHQPAVGEVGPERVSRISGDAHLPGAIHEGDDEKDPHVVLDAHALRYAASGE